MCMRHARGCQVKQNSSQFRNSLQPRTNEGKPMPGDAEHPNWMLKFTVRLREFYDGFSRRKSNRASKRRSDAWSGVCAWPHRCNRQPFLPGDVGSSVRENPVACSGHSVKNLAAQLGGAIRCILSGNVWRFRACIGERHPRICAGHVRSGLRQRIPQDSAVYQRGAGRIRELARARIRLGKQRGLLGVHNITNVAQSSRSSTDPRRHHAATVGSARLALLQWVRRAGGTGRSDWHRAAYHGRHHLPHGA